MERFHLSFDQLMDTPEAVIAAMLDLMSAENLHRNKKEFQSARKDN